MSAPAFAAVPPELSAVEPPEARGLARDEVRLMVAATGRPLRHRRFRDLPRALRPGDLVVLNTSPTEPAALDGRRGLIGAGEPVVLHVSGPAPAGGLVVELRTPDGRRVLDARAGERVRLPQGVVATLVAAHPDADVRVGSRLWLADLGGVDDVRGYLHGAGRPIRYSYLRGQWPLELYNTVHAERGSASGAEFGSAEMPSAGRPVSRAVLDGLRARGVGVATVVLHTGVSSLEAGETPLPERYAVPTATADAVTATRAAGGRVVAVGTTVTRALETVADEDGRVRAGRGWTELVLGPDRPARAVSGLITGWHEPEASHLMLLEAVAGRTLVERAYAAAVDRGYLWHEFGDSCLLLGPLVAARRGG
jgi:S-adenosylmethionine:tRNA ribosyltransferase-isomerase